MMPNINIYKITEEKIEAFTTHLDEAYDCLSEQIQNYLRLNETRIEYNCKLYFSEKDNPTPLKWNWALSMFGQPTAQIWGSPKGVISISTETSCYALTFGHSFFQIDQFSDKEWAFSYAKRMNYKNIKTTALTNPHSQRNKTVNTYLRYDDLEFDSGEALAKLKAKAVLPTDFNLFTENMEFGNSIKLSVKTPTINKIIRIIEHIENGIANDEIQIKIPYFRKIKVDIYTQELENDLISTIEDNLQSLDFSEYQIFATQIIFNDTFDYRYKYNGHSKDIDMLNVDSLIQFVEEYQIPQNDVLNIHVVLCEDGNERFGESIKNLVFFTNDVRKALLMEGEWYLYNDDFLEYLADSIKEIPVVFDAQYNYSKQAHDNFINSKYNEAKETPDYSTLSEQEGKSKLKKKYYKENYFNINLSEQFGFVNFDRELERIGKHKLEVMDLYKDNAMYTVKFGNTSGKLCYAVDQSLEAIKAYKKGLISLGDDINIKEVCIWIVLERNELPLMNGQPDINDLELLILKNKLDLWKKEVRLLGKTPIIRVNYAKD